MHISSLQSIAHLPHYIYKALLLLCFTSCFMHYFYLKNWFPGGALNLLYALGYGASVGLAFIVVNVLLSKERFIEKRQLKKLGVRSLLHFLFIYVFVIVYSLLNDLLIIEPKEFFKIGLIILGIGIFPAISFYYFDQYLQLKKNKLKAPLPNTLAVVDTKIQIPIRNGFYTLDSTAILYAVSNKNYVEIHLDSGKCISLRTTIKQFEAACKDVLFLKRIHRAFVVNLNAVEEIKSKEIILEKSKRSLPVSKTYRTNLPFFNQ